MYSMDGLATATGEITLVLFTTLAPAGIVAYILMALPYVALGSRLEDAMLRNLDKFLILPIFVAMVGLVASTTHLGNPANALYVVSGFGRSPLSNEVVCGVAFLGSAGVFWLTSFSEKERMRRCTNVRRVALTVISLLGVVFLGTMAFAYHVDTILTWNTPLAPASLWLNSLVSGPALALLGFRIARFFLPKHKLGKAYIIVEAVSCVANVLLYVAWGCLLPEMENALTTADALAPFYGVLVAVFAVACTLGIYFSVRTVRYDGEAPLWMPISSTVFMLAGIFVMRFSFYMIHMTVGLGV